MSTYLCIHGHFYQPPRENPWTELVELEPSAAPAHDWNERVYQECYRANDNARVSDPGGLVRDIVSNYESLSFNMGPTLLSWMQAKHPHGYQSLLQADKASVDQRGGHGNAIAQAYNHAILPLCNERDLRTQVRWGLAEFRHRFGREPESMWLPETACDERVLAALIEEGLRYVLLAPRQAAAVRPLGDASAPWADVSDASVDPGRAYLYKHPDGSGRGIALFFYDGPLAQGIAFEDALRSSQAFVDVLDRAPKGEGRLVHVATDGESYGHHSKWGDRSLAWALRHEVTARGFLLVNYGQYLDLAPPTFEVKLALGSEGLGSSWSCEHGIGRWSRDCGCHTGGQEGWTQAWRAPLRQALDLLRDKLAPEFEREAGAFFADPWAARDAYISIVLQPDAAAREAFLRAQAARALSPTESQRALSLLDLQRQLMLMYTSCGWFFNDLSGIETVQILKYACRAMDYAEELGLRPPRALFLEALAQARSNIPEQGDGAEIYAREVEPLRVSPQRLAAHLAISALHQPQPKGELGCWRWAFEGGVVDKQGSMSLWTARLLLEHRVHGGQTDFAVAALHLGGVDFVCSVRPWSSQAAMDIDRAYVQEFFEHGQAPALLRSIGERFGGQAYGLEQLLPDGRAELAQSVFADLTQRMSEDFARVYQENQQQLESLKDTGFALPEELLAAAQHALRRRFEDALAGTAALGVVDAIAQDALRLGVHLGSPRANELVTLRITQAAWQVFTPGGDGLQGLMALLQLTQRLGLHPNLDRAQELAARARGNTHSAAELTELAGLLNLDPQLLLRTRSHA